MQTWNMFWTFTCHGRKRHVCGSATILTRPQRAVGSGCAERFCVTCTCIAVSATSLRRTRKAHRSTYGVSLHYREHHVARDCDPSSAVKMPSMEESRRQVKETLERQATDINHGDILESLQDEIDRHNAAKEGLRDTMRRHRSLSENGERSKRFRFKKDKADSRRDRHRSRSRDDGHRRRKKRRKHENHDETPPRDHEAAHPFPREPTDPEGPTPADAFRDSLFDALADDEGAQYWESVYSQPIHIYARPTVTNEKGELEEMTDEQYVDYVKTKMWEKKHPEAVLEREKAKKQKKQEEEERTRRRGEYARQKQRAAWERAARKGARRFAVNDEDEDDYECTVPSKDWDTSHRSTTDEEQQRAYKLAWSRYVAAWDKLKHELLEQRSAPEKEACGSAAKRIPWPVLHPSKPVIKPNIEAFMRNAPTQESRSRQQVLKAERVRWHPDKIQQRFGGQVDEGTMRLVTGVFQVVDALYEEDRGVSR
jgi:hypothetical protein